MGSIVLLVMFNAYCLHASTLSKWGMWGCEDFPIPGRVQDRCAARGMGVPTTGPLSSQLRGLQRRGLTVHLS